MITIFYNAVYYVLEDLNSRLSAQKAFGRRFLVAIIFCTVVSMMVVTSSGFSIAMNVIELVCFFFFVACILGYEYEKNDNVIAKYLAPHSLKNGISKKETYTRGIIVSVSMGFIITPLLFHFGIA